MKHIFSALLLGSLLAVSPMAMPAYAQATASAMAVAILTPAQAAKLAPATIFFRGQSASTQLRNTEGIRFAKSEILLAGLVDNSGYSSGVQQKYQGFLLTEVPLVIGGKLLPAGAYGFGFIASNQFLVMDIGAHTVLQTNGSTDVSMHRPRPFQILKGATAGTFRFYSGRNYVEFERGK